MNKVDDMRKLMETISHGEQDDINEAGGVIDKTLAKFGNKRAKGKVDVNNEKNSIEDGWKEFAGAQDFDNKNVEGFKDFLQFWNFNGPEIDSIVTEPFNIKQSLKNAAKIQHKSGKGVTGERDGRPAPTPSNDDYKSIIKFYTNDLKGNVASLELEMAAIKNPKLISGDPLASLGYAFMKANGKG